MSWLFLANLVNLNTDDIYLIVGFKSEGRFITWVSSFYLDY